MAVNIFNLIKQSFSCDLLFTMFSLTNSAIIYK